MSADLIVLGIMAAAMLGCVVLLVGLGRSAQRANDAEQSSKNIAKAQEIERDVGRMPAADVDDELRSDWTRPD